MKITQTLVPLFLTLTFLKADPPLATRQDAETAVAQAWKARVEELKKERAAEMEKKEI